MTFTRQDMFWLGQFWGVPGKYGIKKNCMLISNRPTGEMKMFNKGDKIYLNAQSGSWHLFEEVSIWFGL